MGDEMNKCASCAQYAAMEQECVSTASRVGTKSVVKSVRNCLVNQCNTACVSNYVWSLSNTEKCAEVKTDCVFKVLVCLQFSTIMLAKSRLVIVSYS